MEEDLSEKVLLEYDKMMEEVVEMKEREMEEGTPVLVRAMMSSECSP